MIEPNPKWQKCPDGDLGIVVSGDAAVEWIMPYFHKYVRENSDLPVTFFDQGLTPAGKEYAEAHFNVIPFNLDTKFVKEHPNTKERWELVFSPEYLSKRHAWFHKPFILLASPYRRTLWLDIDCKVQHPPEKFLNDFSPTSRFAVTPDFIPEGASRNNTYRNLLCVNLPNETVYNTGVLYAEHGAPFVEEWATFCLKHNDKHLGDQDVLVDLCYHKNLERALFPHLPKTFDELPKSFNWNHTVSENSDAHILHYHSIGKETIFNTMQKENLFVPNLKKPYLQMFFG